MADDLFHPIPKSGERLRYLTRADCYLLLKEGKLKAVRLGEKTLITHESLMSLPAELDPYIPGTSIASQRMVDARRRKRQAEPA
jgi:hypothetical protein